jgi:hypothetical protein
MTNFVTTDQTRSVCAESITLKEAICANDNECQNKPVSPAADGRWTGRCVLSPEVNVSNGMENKRPGVCEYEGRIFWFIMRKLKMTSVLKSRSIVTCYVNMRLFVFHHSNKKNLTKHLLIR